jgi:hypothetical protein
MLQVKKLMSNHNDNGHAHGEDDAIDFSQDPEVEIDHVNQLHDLASQAMQLGLIVGHGYHQGQYELIRQGQILMMSVDEAVQYLSRLIRESAA